MYLVLKDYLFNLLDEKRMTFMESLSNSDNIPLAKFIELRKKAKKTWNLGKYLGISFKRGEEEVIDRLLKQFLEDLCLKN
ncbi:MAG: hypothetical protein Q8877_02720 [Sweet potato little leaf phytoplasma]|nr:hypothetical protein [Sweet potato little leaf phytoplasma]